MIRKKNKRNPKYINDNLIDHLKIAVKYGSPNALKNSLVYYNQGMDCNDCNQLYSLCECEKCKDCEWDRCMCDLGFTYTNWRNADNNIKQFYEKRVQQKAMQFAEQILTKKQLKELLR